MFSEATIVKQGNNYIAKYGDDSGLYVEFTVEAVEDKAESVKQGRTIFKDKEYITINIIGDKNTVRKRPVKLVGDNHSAADPERWPRQWQAFKNQQVQTQEGTPITEWPMITKSDAASFKAMNIHTVDALANLGENNLNWMGARSMRDKARAWIEQAKSGQGISQLQDENDKLRSDIEALKNQMDAFMNSVKPAAKSEE